MKITHTRRQLFARGAAATVAAVLGDLAAVRGGTGEGAASAASSYAGPPITLRFANAGGPNSALGQGLKHWAELCEQRSSGRLKIQAFINGELGPEGQVFKEITTGSVDGSVTAVSYLNTLVPQYNVFDMPFMASDERRMINMLNGPVGKKLLALSVPKGIKTLAWNLSGIRSVLSRSPKPPTALSDYRGIKMRIVQSPLFVKIWSLIGVVPTPISTAEIYLSLSRGLIEAADVSPDYAAALKWHEAAKSFVLMEHGFPAGVFYMNLAKFNNLPEELQQIVATAARDSAVWSYGVLDRLNTSAYATFRKAGLHVVTDFDRTPFIKRTAPVYDAYRPLIGAALLEEVVAAVRT